MFLNRLTKKTLYIALLSLSLHLSFAADIHWQKLAQQDLTAAKKYLKDDSIGGADQSNPSFNAWLNNGYQSAIVKSKKVNSASSYNLVLNFYLNQFHDEHIEYVPYLKRFDFPRLWPGFIIYFENDHYWVSAISRLHTKDIPPAHAELISCNGQHIHTLMLQRVFPYFGNVKLNADWHINIPRLFFYPPNPWFSPLHSCLFDVAGEKKVYTLHWKKISAARARQLRHQASYNQVNPTGSHTFTKNSIWVNLPSFMPRSATQIQALTNLIKAASSWKNKNIIVFDTRGNLGGLSIWGSQILKNLYGKLYYSQQTYPLQNSQYQWRVSAGNLQELNSFFLPMIQKSFGTNSSEDKQLQKTIQGLKKALLNKQSLYPQKITRITTLQNELVIPNPVKAHIYWVTDGLCASSCLTFGDQLTHFPNVVQIGQPTHADTDYTKWRTFILSNESAALS